MAFCTDVKFFLSLSNQTIYFLSEGFKYEFDTGRLKTKTGSKICDKVPGVLVPPFERFSANKTEETLEKHPILIQGRFLVGEPKIWFLCAPSFLNFLVSKDTPQMTFSGV